MQLPNEYSEICPTLREELEEAFETYWVESSMQTYIRGVYEDFDQVSLEELENEAQEFIEGYLRDRLMDFC